MVADPARGQLNREKEFSLSSFAPENVVLRDKIAHPIALRGLLAAQQAGTVC